MTESITRKKATNGEEHNTPDETTYKVWIEIEEYDERTGCGNNCDAPGGALATFGTYEEAYDFAEQIDSAYSNYPGPVNATKPFTVVGYWTDNEQGFIETTMAASVDDACDRARQEIATRDTADWFALEGVEWVNQSIRIIAVFHGHLNCAFCKLDLYSIARHVACTAADHVTPAPAECPPGRTGFCSPHSASEPKTLLKEDTP